MVLGSDSREWRRVSKVEKIIKQELDVEKQYIYNTSHADDRWLPL